MNVLSNINNKAGFTVLEVLIALVIFAVGILGVATMQVSSIQGNSKGRQISEATDVVSSQIEMLLSLDYADIVDTNGNGTGQDLDGDGVDDDGGNFGLDDNTLATADGSDVVDGYTLFWNVAVNHPTDRTKTIRVFVEGPQITPFSLDMVRVDI